MKLMVLGGGWSQISAIRRAKERGYEVIVADYDPIAPGLALADFTSRASTFSHDDVIADARRYTPDGILTLGTDQPVLTAARATKVLGLPFPIDCDTALAVTNKKVMKETLIRAGIPVVDYRILRPGFTDDDIRELSFPAVTKPLDSQGQRGVYLIDSPDQVRKVMSAVLSYSREREILIETYYPSEEITVNGWVTDGNLHILTVVDRVTRMFPPNIGVCTAHIYPSRHMERAGRDIIELSHSIVSGIGITNGPIYFQMLIGNEGVKVNEIACRLGGAYEDRYIHLETGVRTLDLLIDSALGINPDSNRFAGCPFPDHQSYISVPLFFTHPGVVKENGSVGEILGIPGVEGCGYLLRPGTDVKGIENSTGRAGYFIARGTTRDAVNQTVDTVFSSLKILDTGDKNIILDTREDAFV